MVAIGRKAKVSYTGYLEDGTVFDSTQMHDGRLLEFTVGKGETIPGFDKAVSEMAVGESRRVSIPCKMAYGEYDEGYREAIPCKSFPHWRDLPVGGYVVLNTAEGPFRIKIDKIEDGLVHIDKNHELAGHDLVFDITVEDAEGENLDAIEREQEGGCACGCDILREQLEGCDHHHGHEHAHARGGASA